MMSIFDFRIVSKNEKSTELYQKHFLNAINGLLANGCTDYDKLILDAGTIAEKAVEFLKESQQKGIFKKFGDILKF